jgi:cell division protein FtsW (lipid II flippase)
MKQIAGSFLTQHHLPQLPLIGELGFQPSEFAKLSLILFLSANIPILIKDRKTPFVFYILTTGLVSALVLLQPNMSTAVTLF